MLLIRDRLQAATGIVSSETDLARAERLALHARKIVEGIAFAALSAVEAKSGRSIPGDRTSDADTLLKKLASRGLLRLPASQWHFLPETEDIKIVSHGNATADLTVDDLQEIFSRASSVLHERHPERRTSEWVGDQLRQLKRDIERLRNWLWRHLMFVGDEAFIIRMGSSDENFFGVMNKEVVPPAEG